MAPAVESLIVTDCADEYVPAATENVGVAAGAVIVYFADATALFALLVEEAIACKVSVELTVIGPEYTAEDVVGVVPLVV